jgi:putative ABC transport system substrate-binding protein
VPERRQLLAAAALALAAPSWCFAQQRLSPPGTWRIGFLSLRNGPDAHTDAFRSALREQGYVEGRNVAIEYRWAAEDRERLPALAAELARLKVDVLVTGGTAVTEAAQRATRTIPIVMAAVSDPVGGGLVGGLARPGGNVTGLTMMTPELAGKRLQLIRELLPKTSRVAVLASPNAPAQITERLLDQIRPAAQQLGIQPLVAYAKTAEELPDAFAAMQRDRAQALIVQISPFTLMHRARIAELAAQQRLPAIYDDQSYVEAGGLASYGPSMVGMHRQAATFVARILKGASPAELPIEQPTIFELAINMKTAKALGITIPRSVLLRADRVIE